MDTASENWIRGPSHIAGCVHPGAVRVAGVRPGGRHAQFCDGALRLRFTKLRARVWRNSPVLFQHTNTRTHHTNTRTHTHTHTRARLSIRICVSGSMCFPETHNTHAQISSPPLPPLTVYTSPATKRIFCSSRVSSARHTSDSHTCARRPKVNVEPIPGQGEREGIARVRQGRGSGKGR